MGVREGGGKRGLFGAVVESETSGSRPSAMGVGRIENL